MEDDRQPTSPLLGREGSIKLNFDFDSPTILKSPLISPQSSRGSSSKAIQLEHQSNRRLSAFDAYDHTFRESVGLLNMIGKRKSSGNRQKPTKFISNKLMTPSTTKDHHRNSATPKLTLKLPLQVQVCERPSR